MLRLRAKLIGNLKKERPRELRIYTTKDICVCVCVYIYVCVSIYIYGTENIYRGLSIYI